MPGYPIASADNVSLFREYERMRGSDAAEALGSSRSTAHRLLAMLEYHRFAWQDPATKAYLPGPALIEIGSPRSGGLDGLNALARPAAHVLGRQHGFHGAAHRPADVLSDHCSRRALPGEVVDARRRGGRLDGHLMASHRELDDRTTDAHPYREPRTSRVACCRPCAARRDDLTACVAAASHVNIWEGCCLGVR